MKRDQLPSLSIVYFFCRRTKTESFRIIPDTLYPSILSTITVFLRAYAKVILLKACFSLYFYILCSKLIAFLSNFSFDFCRAAIFLIFSKAKKRDMLAFFYEYCTILFTEAG